MVGKKNNTQALLELKRCKEMENMDIEIVENRMRDRDRNRNSKILLFNTKRVNEQNQQKKKH